MSDSPKSALPLKNLSDSLLHSMHGAGAHFEIRPFIIAFVILLVGFLFLDPDQTLRNFSFVGFFAPLWVPIMLYHFTFEQFVESRKAEFINNQETVLLEILMPRDTKKTPLAMEIILANMHQNSGEGTRYNRYWLGKVRAWWSLEIVSLGGRVHFYVWTRAGFRRSIESYFYAQFPDVQIIEAEDYSLVFDPTSHDNSVWGTDFVKSKTDPQPIKTYIDFGLDKAGAKPEEISDPLAQLIELLGSIGPKEQLWIQLVIRVTGVEKYGAEAKTESDPKYNWKTHGEIYVKKLQKATASEGSYVDLVTGKLTKTPGFPNPTKGQGDAINAIEKNIGKLGFDTGIRAIYTAPKEDYKGFMIGPTISIFKPFNSESNNSLKTAGNFSAQFDDFPWEDPSGHRHEVSNKKLVDAYRRRSFYHAPYVGDWAIMSTEELATIFHVPSGSVTTPGLPRIQSTTSGAPTNLPT
jgi:hypothetical protein